MSRPLVITDCDEVLLHMVRHFREWLGEEHGIAFALEGNPFAQSMTRTGAAAPLEQGEVFELLEGFFHTEMARQTAIDGATAAIAELQRDADVVVLTNLGDHFNEARRLQLLDHGITARVFTNQGPKGAALDRIMAEYAPTRAVFIDDLAHHHESVMGVRPEVARLHLCGEPSISGHVPCAHTAGHAHARIDDWSRALPWVVETLHGERA
jgi:hypothetical protein